MSRKVNQRFRVRVASQQCQLFTQTVGQLQTTMCLQRYNGTVLIDFTDIINGIYAYNRQEYYIIMVSSKTCLASSLLLTTSFIASQQLLNTTSLQLSHTTACLTRAGKHVSVCTQAFAQIRFPGLELSTSNLFWALLLFCQGLSSINPHVYLIVTIL